MLNVVSLSATAWYPA